MGPSPTPASLEGTSLGTAAVHGWLIRSCALGYALDPLASPHSAGTAGDFFFATGPPRSGGGGLRASPPPPGGGATPPPPPAAPPAGGCVCVTHRNTAQRC